MRDGAPSHTAQLVAAQRLHATRAPASYGDPDADERLGRDVAGEVSVDGASPMHRYLMARTAFFDRYVVNGVDAGVTQFVSVGAGYDGRALRYAHPDVQWFELDHPATQRDKRARLDRLGVDATNIQFIETEIGVDPIIPALLAAGFEPDAPTRFICEGLAIYLAPDVLARLLTDLRALASPGGRLALSSGCPVSDPDRREAFAARVAAFGEPVELGGADVPALVAAARWKVADISGRATSIGLMVASAQWDVEVPIDVAPTESRSGRYLERTFTRHGVADLADHLTDTYGVPVTSTRRLDVGVFRVDRVDGSRWVARVFPAERPREIADRDASNLAWLASRTYPAERLAADPPVSDLDGQAVLVTQFAAGRPSRVTRSASEQAGALLGLLHTLPDPPAHVGGAWHHLTFDGGPTEEIRDIRALLEMRTHVPSSWRANLDTLRDLLASLDDLRDLPTVFTHPDFVNVNLLTDGSETTVIDWAGAGVAPRLWSLSYLICTAADRGGQRHAIAVANGFRRHVRLEPEELDRLPAALQVRPAMFQTWLYATGRQSLDVTAGNLSGLAARSAAIAAQVAPALR
jgi:methyltransferase (TIGR00027 family)